MWYTVGSKVNDSHPFRSRANSLPVLGANWPIAPGRFAPGRFRSWALSLPGPLAAWNFHSWERNCPGTCY